MNGESHEHRDRRIRELWQNLDTRNEGQLDLSALKKGLRKIDHPLKNADELLALDADVVLFMPRVSLKDPTILGSPAAAWVDEVTPILASGKNVVSSIATGIHYRQLADGNSLVARLNAACAEGNVSIFFTGVDPGFVSDALAIALTSSIVFFNVPWTSGLASLLKPIWVSLTCRNSGLPATVLVAAAARPTGVTMPPLKANSVPAPPKARHLSAPLRDG